jgi:mevalonate kinase
VTVSARGAAHGKVILLGEHACVYGTPALAGGIDRGARAEVTRTDGVSVLTLGGDEVRADGASDDDRARAFRALLAEGAEAPTVRVAAASDLPPGGGLGSSAALGVAISRAVEALASEPPDEARALARAVAWERIFHGNPSGIDTAVAAGGGCIRFTRGEGIRPVPPQRELWLAIGLSGESSSTRAMVDGVARFRDKKPELFERSIEGVRSLVENAVLAVRAGDVAALGRLMDLNQMILAGLMLSTERIEALCAYARRNGALGAKLTGAGGGGSVVALAPSGDVAQAVVDAWKAKRYEGFVTHVPATHSGSGAS